MKLCRFELNEEPGKTRSGFAYEGRVYETDGTNPIGVYEWSQVRLLSPLGRANSIRLFEPTTDSGAFPAFHYLNPAAVFGPGVTYKKPPYAVTLRVEPCLAVVIGGAGTDVPIEKADELVLGITLAASFFAPDEHLARARDAGIAFGPAITTPDELDDSVTEHPEGRRYRFPVAAAVNGEDLLSQELGDLKYTVAEYIRHASESATLRQSDVLLIPLGEVEKPVEVGDEVQVKAEKLGVLRTRIN